MRAIARYAYLNARVSGMAARLLSDRGVDELIDKADEQDGGLLQAAGLAGGEPEHPADTGLSLEQQLIASLLADFVILVRALSAAPRRFFIYWACRFELSNLKAIMRGKMAGEPAAQIRAQLVDMGPYGRLPVDELLGTQDVAELLRRLEHTPFGAIAREARRIYEERRELFAMDAAVDRRYYAGLSEHLQSLERGDRRQLDTLVGDIIDRTNLLWLLRYRFSYGLPPAQTYYLLIPAGDRLRAPLLQRLSRLETIEEVIAGLPQPFSRPLSGVTTAADATLILERGGWRKAETILRSRSVNLARVLAYLVLREKLLRQLRAVIKGRRLGLAPDLIRGATGLIAAFGPG
ncbi:MAG: V-type ATPase subunit [Acidiferrobacterales bacterium]